MDGVNGASDQLLKSAANQLRGSQRRCFLAEVCETLCGGNARAAEYRFGWGRETVEKGMAERAMPEAERAEQPPSGNRGRQPGATTV
ncbi:MAG: hypothetical protein KDA80_17590 [Planctomycetaceae bacterium]|nr:hypothetical protein [Planctomycetaceae bacterium]